MKAKFLSLNFRDFFKGLVVAILTAVITFAYAGIQDGTLFQEGSLKKAGMVALAALLGYLLKNLFTNSQGEILVTEKNATKQATLPVNGK